MRRTLYCVYPPRFEGATRRSAPPFSPVVDDDDDGYCQVDKTGKVRGKIRITHIELRRWADFSDAVAKKIGAPLEEIGRMAAFANSRAIRPDEEMRVTYFELL
jgi:hypothetical protein